MASPPAPSLTPPPPSPSTQRITYNLPSQPAFTRVIDRSRDNLGRDSGWQLKKGNTIENQAEYQYSATDGRLFKVLGLASSSLPSPQFTYNYTPNSHLLASITGHTVTNTYEPIRDVLASKENKAGTTIISKYDYTVNAIGQRTNVSTSGTAFPATPSWSWGYDSIGQVISADSSVNTRDRAYQYDAIGNRKKSADSLTLPGSDNYTSNELNQYSSLSLNSQPATLNDYDDDGNLTSGQLPTGSAGLVWDAENRLIAVNVIGQETIHYAYDAQSRRISRSVGVSPTASSTIYIYDAWNVIAEYSGTSLTKTYLWGTDLSGSLQGAGGVGGLLCESQISNSQISNFYPTYDGNGNVSEYLAADGSTAAHFEYDPFGNTVVNTDTSNQFAYRFSTKPLDQVTGLYYYGYRYYDPVTGRWASRDPIGEMGGLNLNGFVGNDGVGLIDWLGLEVTPSNGDWNVDATFTNGEEPCNNTAILKSQSPGKESGENDVDNFGKDLGDGWTRKHRNVTPIPDGKRMIPSKVATFRWTAKVECIDKSGKDPKVISSDATGEYSISIGSAVKDAKAMIIKLKKGLKCPNPCCIRTEITVTREQIADGNSGNSGGGKKEDK